MMAATGPELVIGIVTPVGTNTEALVANIRGALSSWAYSSQVVKLTDRLRLDQPPVGEFEDARVERLIAAGNEFCRRHQNSSEPNGDPAAMARLAVSAIQDYRIRQHRSAGRVKERAADLAGAPVERRAYIIHSLKRPAEVKFLRDLYGRQFVLLASQGTVDERLHNLMGRSLSATDEASKRAVATRLMEKDAEEQDPLGQRVNDTYPMADFFLHRSDVGRTLAVLFGDQREAPHSGEYAMYVAHATAARSLAASRKVGAVLVREASVVSAGYNDVPFGQVPDVVAGTDTSERLKEANVTDTVNRLISAGWVPPPPPHGSSETPAKSALEALRGGELLNVIEYQRPVHAEAQAIDDAARRGVATSGAHMYVTTFPCHLCFKHVLSAGVSEVRYIDPYSKSRAREMFPKAAEERLTPYEGVAPAAYVRFFSERPPPVSNAGAFPVPDPATAQPLVYPMKPMETIANAERVAVSTLEEKYR